MRYQADHDLHIHSYISGCAGHDPRQTKEAILSYGLSTGLGLVGVADHIWDEDGPGTCQLWRGSGNTLKKGMELLPLPQSEQCNFIFGIEADIDMEGNIAVARHNFDAVEFMVFSPSHLHMLGVTVDPEKVSYAPIERKEYYKKRIYEVLDMDLPFEKTGMAHFTSTGVCEKQTPETIDLFTDKEFEDMFALTAERGMGIELNAEDVPNHIWTSEQRERLLRPYRIAKKMGCKFYLGSDAHTPEWFVTNRREFEWLIDALELTEDDKLPFVREHLPKEYVWQPLYR